MKITADLERYWRERLRQSGFEDLETSLTQGDGLLSRRGASRLYMPPNGLALQDTPGPGDTASTSAMADYYDSARELAADNTWAPADVRAAWKLHAEGLGYREIAERTGIAQKVARRAIHAGQRRIGALPKISNQSKDADLPTRRKRYCVKKSMHVPIELCMRIYVAACGLSRGAPDIDVHAWGYVR